jgi:hypothetical protein
MFIRTFLHPAADLARDARFAVRSLWRAKGLAATVVVTLGLGTVRTPQSSPSSVASAAPAGQPRRRPLDLHPSGAPGVGIDNYKFDAGNCRLPAARHHRRRVR